MKFKSLLLLLAFAGMGTSLSAQSKVVLSIPDVVATGQEEIICVPVIADSFPNINAIQFTPKWDSTEIRFVEFRLGDNPIGFTDMTFAMQRPDELRVSFLPSDGLGITLAPETTIFELCFEARNDSGFSRIGFGGALAPEFAQFGSFMAFPFDTMPGSISYGGTVATTVLPGDTDDNQQVDHRDLLNIGLVAGATGPARTNATSDFTEQTALVWPDFLNNGINYAKVDADGNGTIAGTDGTVVTANYHRVNDGNFEFAPSVATPAGPALSVSFADIPDAGQETTMTINLGNGNNPNAVGYGLAFTLDFDPTRVDMSTLTFDYAGSFLGDDLLTLAEQNTTAPNIVEVALTRTDQLNTTVPGGLVMTVSFMTIANDDNSNYDTQIGITPNAFIRSDQTTAPINGGSTEVTVMGTSAVRTAAWATGADVFPNPTTGMINVRNIDTLDGLTYTVFSQLGQLMRSGEYTNSQIELGGLPNGVYLVRLTDGLDFWSTTVVVRAK